jgi:Flp pilus assembly protein TadG
MRKNSFRTRAGRKPESGQAMLFTLLGLGIFLIGAMAFAIDISNLWFSRQSAQTAADAACTAGAMDLLVDATNGTVNQGGFNTSTSANPFDCSTSQTPAPCQYATLNGFGSSIASGSTALGNNVSFDWSPTTPAPAGVTAPAATIAPVPFMRVTVTDNIPTFFAGMLKGMNKQSVSAIAICGVSQSAAPIPILVLDPNSPHATPQQSALNITGTPAITIFGGPSRSIQVNSAANAGSCGSSNCSVNSPWGAATIDLSQAGPLGTGADMALSGHPTAAMSGFNGGTTGHWIAPAAPIMDPFAQVCYPGQTANCSTTINGNSAPSVPGAPTVPADEGPTRWTGTVGSATGPCTAIPCSVAYKDHGCPDPSATRTNGNCLLYTAGFYGSPGIQIGPSGGAKTALFDPGLYYVVGGLGLNSTGDTARPGTGLGDGSGGVTFYFSGTGTVSVAASSGTHTLDDFNTLTGPVDSTGNQYANVTTVNASQTNVTYTMGAKCLSSSVLPSNLVNGGAGVNIGSDTSNSPAVQNGANLLMGPCTGYYGDPLGALEPASIGEQRWFLFFQDRSAIAVQPQWGGSGQFLLAGTMYFHSCKSNGEGVSCTPPPNPATASSYYQDIFSMQGSAGSGTYVLGEIVTDNLTLGGTSGIVMDLNPTTAFNILKASLYQ